MDTHYGRSQTVLPATNLNLHNLMNNSTRYQGKPLLRILECYVLKSIGYLSPEDATRLTMMQPKLAQLYGKNGSWDQIIVSVMELPDNMPELIRQVWNRNKDIAATSNQNLRPQDFAEMFVDMNLS